MLNSTKALTVSLPYRWKKKNKISLLLSLQKYTEIIVYKQEIILYSHDV